MAGYLDSYGEGDERRNRIVKGVAITIVAVLVIGVTAYLIFENFREKQAVSHFLSLVNAGRYQEAYGTWGCSEAHPCSGYSYQKFLEDWGKQSQNDWKISNVDGCRTGVVVTVRAQGSEPEPLWVQRSNDSISFSPWPECQGKKWRFRQFFRRIIGG